MVQGNCFLCDTNASLDNPIEGDFYIVNCNTCGKYRITSEVTEDILPNNKQKYILSGLIRSYTLKGQILSIHTQNFDDLIANAFSPESPIEMIDMFLIHLSKISEPLDKLFDIKDSDYPLIYARNLKEYRFILRKASELGYIKIFNNAQCRLEIDGWKRVNHLIDTKKQSNNVFVAMWFNESTLKLRDAIRNSINVAGYNPIIADEGEYTGNIMDFILGSIKQSKFVIADFTTIPEVIDDKNKLKVIGGVRGGVYYESGFAKGYGLKVIHLCKDDKACKTRLHFDIEQENTIFWKDEDCENLNIRSTTERKTEISPKNLSEKIYDRIMNIFGPGNLI